MFILTGHWDVRLFWGVLPVTAKFYLFFLLMAAAYTIYFLTRTLSRLHRLPQGAPTGNETRLRLRLIELTNGMENLRKFHTLLFLLFGVFFTDEMFATLQSIRLSAASLSGARMDIFEAPTAFASSIGQWRLACNRIARRASKPTKAVGVGPYCALYIRHPSSQHTWKLNLSVRLRSGTESHLVHIVALGFRKCQLLALWQVVDT